MAQSAPTVLLRRDDYDTFANDESAMLDVDARSPFIDHGIPMESINVGPPPGAGATRGEDGEANEPGLRNRWQMPKTKKKKRDIDAEGEELVWPLPSNVRGTDADLNMLVHLCVARACAPGEVKERDHRANVAILVHLPSARRRPAGTVAM